MCHDRPGRWLGGRMTAGRSRLRIFFWSRARVPLPSAPPRQLV